MPKTTAPPKIPLTVRITLGDKEVLEQRAAARGISPGEMARECLTEALHGPFATNLDDDQAYAGPQVNIKEQQTPQRAGRPHRSLAHIEEG